MVNIARMAAILMMTVLAGCGHLGIFEPYREVSCLAHARLSLTEAIAAAQQGGGTALDADYREDEEMGCLGDNPGVYDITLFGPGEITAVSVDANTGKVGPRQQAGVMNALFSSGIRFEGSSGDMARLIPGLSMTLSEAISMTERQGGKALAAWVEVRDQKPGYTVKTVQNGRVYVAWVDASGR